MYGTNKMATRAVNDTYLHQPTPKKLHRQSSQHEYTLHNQNPSNFPEGYPEMRITAHTVHNKPDEQKDKPGKINR